MAGALLGGHGRPERRQHPGRGCAGSVRTLSVAVHLYGLDVQANTKDAPSGSWATAAGAMSLKVEVGHGAVRAPSHSPAYGRADGPRIVAHPPDALSRTGTLSFRAPFPPPTPHADQSFAQAATTTVDPSTGPSEPYDRPAQQDGSGAGSDYLLVAHPCSPNVGARRTAAARVGSGL